MLSFCQHPGTAETSNRNLTYHLNLIDMMLLLDGCPMKRKVRAQPPHRRDDGRARTCPRVKGHDRGLRHDLMPVDIRVIVGQDPLQLVVNELLAGQILTIVLHVVQLDGRRRDDFAHTQHHLRDGYTSEW